MFRGYGLEGLLDQAGRRDLGLIDNIVELQSLEDALDLGKGEFDRVQLWAIGWSKDHGDLESLHLLLDDPCMVHAEVVTV